MVYGGNGDFWKGDKENLFLTSPPTISYEGKHEKIHFCPGRDPYN